MVLTIEQFKSRQSALEKFKSKQKYHKFPAWEIKKTDNPRLEELAKKQFKQFEKRIDMPFYTFVDGFWKLINPKAPCQDDSQPEAKGKGKGKEKATEKESSVGLDRVVVFTWHIESDVNQDGQMKKVLSWMDTKLRSISPNVAVVINFQCLQDYGFKNEEPCNISDIIDTPWIQQRFNVTAINDKPWLRKSTGPLMLFDRRMAVIDLFQLPLITSEKKVLSYAWILSVAIKSDKENQEASKQQFMHFANVELESEEQLILEIQLQALYYKLRGESPSNKAAILSGLMGLLWQNADGEYLPLGWRDSWPELGHLHPNEKGDTRSKKTAYPGEKLRQDRFCSSGAVRPTAISILGREDPELDLFHYGLMVECTLLETIETTGDTPAQAAGKLENLTIE